MWHPTLALAFNPVQTRALHLSCGVHDIHGVAEVPVMTYTASLPLGLKRRRCLTITGTGAATTRHVLRAARAVDCAPVVILTHPFEFAKTRDATYSKMRPNRINQRRLEDLCRFVATHPADFVMAGVTEAAEQAPMSNTLTVADVTAGPGSVLPDLAANRLNDLVWRL